MSSWIRAPRPHYTAGPGMKFVMWTTLLIALSWRFSTGHPMDGKRLTDATFFRKGYRQFSDQDALSFWAFLPFYQRMLVRWVVLFELVLAVHWSITGSWWTGIPAAFLALAALALAVRKLSCGVLEFKHNRVLVSPMTRALAPMLGTNPKAPGALVQLPRNFRKIRRGLLGSVVLPEHFPAGEGQRKAVDQVISSRMPVSVRLDWDLKSVPFKIAINAAPQPPSLVLFSSLTEAMQACSVGTVVLGLDADEKIFYGSFMKESPHWVVSAGSGTGKSSFLCCVAAQLLRQHPQAEVTGIDPKMCSFDPLTGLPGFEVANNPRDMAGMWAAIERFRDVMVQRMELYAVDKTVEFPPKFLFLEELGVFAARSRIYWDSIRDRTQRVRPPIYDVIAECLMAGRQFSCFVVSVTQDLRENVLPGGLRDLCGLAALGGYKKPTWNRLVGTTYQEPQKGVGRWIYVSAGEQVWVQNVWGPDEEIRDWADRRLLSQVGVTEPSLAGVVGRSATSDSPVIGELWVVGLEAGAAHLGLTVDAFRQRRHRAGGSIPGESRRGNQPTWRMVDLEAWADSDRHLASVS